MKRILSILAALCMMIGCMPSALAAKPVITKQPVSQTVEEGGTVTFSFRCKNRPSAITWYFVNPETGKEIPASKISKTLKGIRVSGQNTYTLTLKKVPSSAHGWGLFVRMKDKGSVMETERVRLLIAGRETSETPDTAAEPADSAADTNDSENLPPEQDSSYAGRFPDSSDSVNSDAPDDNPAEADSMHNDLNDHPAETDSISGDTDNLTDKEHSAEDAVFLFTDDEDGSCTVIGYQGNKTEIAIPSFSPSGLPVTAIGEGAFREREDLTGISIPEGILSIGDSAFCHCRNLTGSLILPDSVTVIGSNAFAGCSSFTGSLILPDSVTSIGDSAFMDCTGFTGTLTLGSHVTSIGNSAFSGCCSLTGRLTIPDTVTGIGNEAFLQCSGFTGGLFIPDSVTRIGSAAFKGCSGLSGSLILPGSVKSIGIEAFSREHNLSNICCIPDSYAWRWCLNNGYEERRVVWNGIADVSDDGFVFSDPGDGTCILIGYIGSDSEIVIPAVHASGLPVTVIGDGAFRDRDDIISIRIPDGILTIGDSAFFGCRKLSGDLSVPDSVTAIGNKAFEGCIGFDGILTIPGTVKSIGEQAFYNCGSFSDIDCAPGSYAQQWFIENGFGDKLSGLS